MQTHDLSQTHDDVSIEKDLLHSQTLLDSGQMTRIEAR